MGFRVTLEAQRQILFCFPLIILKSMILWKKPYTRHYFIFYVWFIQHFLAIVIWLYKHNKCYAGEIERNVIFLSCSHHSLNLE